MGRFSEMLRRFMAGRYGGDSLNNALFWAYMVLILANLLFKNLALYLLSLLIFVIYMFRCMSRNIYKRSEENRKFIAFNGRLRGIVARGRTSSDGTHVFRNCVKCKARLRLPHKRGKHLVRCPKCGELFHVRIWF